MSATFTTADAVLKEDYKGPMQEQLNNTCVLLAQAEKNTDDVVGRHAVVPIHTGRTSGVGARGENGTLPTAGSQAYKTVRVPLRQNYGRIQLTGPVIRAMSKDRGSFIRAVDSETTGVTRDLKRDVNRQAHGTANGVIAQCGTTSASTTLVLADDTTATQIRQAFFDGGMVIDIGTVADPDSVQAATAVTDFDEDNLTLTIADSVTTTGSHFIFRAGSGGASDNSGDPGGGDGQFELTGAQSLFDDTADIQTIDTSAVTIWKSTVLANGGTLRSISENLVNKAIQDTEIKSGRKINLLLSNAPVHRGLANDLEASRRNVDNVALEAGYSGIRWSAVGEGKETDTKPIALVWDQDCVENTLYGLATEDLVEYVGSDWEWMDEDGAVLSRVSGKDAYEATLFKYHELGIRQRNAHFRIDDIAHID